MTNTLSCEMLVAREKYKLFHEVLPFVDIKKRISNEHLAEHITIVYTDHFAYQLIGRNNK